MKAVEMYYTVGEVALLLRLHERTIIKRMRERAFGEQVVNVGGVERPDYRIAASGVNAYLEANSIFAEPGVVASSEEELRHKTAEAA